MGAGGASSKRLPSSIPAGYESQTGYQYDSISRVAGQREPAPPSNFSKLGGFRNKVFITDAIFTLTPSGFKTRPDYSSLSRASSLLDFDGKPNTRLLPVLY